MGKACGTQTLTVRTGWKWPSPASEFACSKPSPISRTPRLALPNLFVAQAQKELTVNEAFARIDALLHLAVEGEANDPPAAPTDGECWLVGDTPTGVWSAQAGMIASRQAGNWLFTPPVEGMVVRDKAAGQSARYGSGWQRAAAVTTPTGGSTEDSEARAAIAQLVAALQISGILATT
ncbi:DUF2793 domain-containing protein [Aurantiacibacter gilvus]|uniref:DUF2793 domain-containing protein n=1 Tax=Aurantiacibacter gilvus TaxID=3139141 RepID=A0ABU9IGV7_9SPHN